ncbi:hypothetical protein EKPV-NSW-ORF002 [Eastern grey kangaroopox virus]|uniref:Uncharacterized protein n=1 Tax=Eastern grey kangaroopox virus TaxID=2042482 RepID=A0A2H4QTR6_9POXV|nr:hypothetical protein EKPV-NSW-ORF184 [Eastern grey kangaroopox virus]AXK50153.1 hypothetical protein EKPV-NSW-ORF002 [Eastern grey kangaroopox virus]
MAFKAHRREGKISASVPSRGKMLVIRRSSRGMIVIRTFRGSGRALVRHGIRKRDLRLCSVRGNCSGPRGGSGRALSPRRGGEETLLSRGRKAGTTFSLLVGEEGRKTVLSFPVKYTLLSSLGRGGEEKGFISPRREGR